MKNKISAAIAVLLLLLCPIFAGCNEEEAAATPDEAATVATADEAQTTADVTAASTAAETQPATQQKTQNSTAPSDSTQPTTQTPVQDNIPADTITDANVNPSLYNIIDSVINEIYETAIKSVALTMDSVTLKKGETAGIQIIITPENAIPKTCTAKADNNCVQTSIIGSYLQITGKSEGKAVVTLTSYNGATAQCAVTVTGSEGSGGSGGSGGTGEITDDTVLPHAKLCTKENAQRWLEAVESYCLDVGLKKNAALSGDSVSVSTADYQSDGSFNSYRDQIVSDAAAQIDTYTGKNYTEYEFNCILEPDGSEYTIGVTLYRISAE